MKTLLSAALLLPALSYGATFTLEAGAKTTAYDYTETSSPVVLDTEDSDLGDVNGGYARLGIGLWKNDQGGTDGFEAYVSHTEGDTRYIGALLGSGNPYGSVVSTTENTYDDLQLNFVRTMPQANTTYLVRAGLGYYSWERALSAFQVETYSWYYAQIGIGIEEHFDKGLSLGLDVTGQYAFGQEMETSWPGYTFDLGRVYTVRTSIPLTIPLTDKLAFRARAEYEYTSIGKSNIIGGYYEPDSEQKNWNLYAGVIIDF